MPTVCFYIFTFPINSSHFINFFKKMSLKIFIYLAALGISCSAWSSLIMVHGPSGPEARGILVP